MVPEIRIATCNGATVRADGDFVMYWMIAFRRTAWNFSLQRAVEWAVELEKPLLVFEPLRIGYRWANDRIHCFVIDGMADNAARIARLKGRGVSYFPYVEPAPDAGNGLLAAFAARACVVVTDYFPSFFLPRMVSAAAPRLPVRLERVDSNGLLPLRVADRVFTTAFSFRSFLQKELRLHLEQVPQSDPLARVTLPALKALPTFIARRWARASAKLLSGGAAELAALPIDHSVGAVDGRGGPAAARRRLRRFLDRRLARYFDDALGKKDPRMDRLPGRCHRRHGRTQQPLRHRRPQPELVLRHHMGSRPL